MDKIAVVILNYNGISYLKIFLPSVIENSKEARIYVIDNCSTDDSLTYINQHFPDVHIITLSKNFGYAGGYAYGLRKIKAKYYVLLNSDVEVTVHWLQPMYQYMEENPSCAAVQPKILSYKNKDEFEHAGAAGGYLDIFGYPYCRGRIFDTVEKDLGQYNIIEEIFWASGCSLFVRSADYYKVGELDEDFFAHMEEIDLCWRFWRNGNTVVYIPKSVIYHLGGGTLPNKNPMKVKLNFRNSAFCLLKNLPKNKVWYLVYLKLILDGIAFLRFLFRGEFSFAAALFKGHRDFFSMSKKIWDKRSGTNFEVPKRIIKKKSIVWTYFVHKKKYYSTFQKK